MVRFSSCDFHSIVEGERGRDTGERGKNYKTLRDISQSKKKQKRWEPTKTGREQGLKANSSNSSSFS